MLTYSDPNIDRYLASAVQDKDNEQVIHVSVLSNIGRVIAMRLTGSDVFGMDYTNVEFDMDFHSGINTHKCSGVVVMRPDLFEDMKFGYAEMPLSKLLKAIERWHKGTANKDMDCAINVAEQSEFFRTSEYLNFVLEFTLSMDLEFTLP